MGYLHDVKPKLTGGMKQDSMGISPEAHKEWKDSEGKHALSGAIAKADPDSLAEREVIVKTKNANADKQVSGKHSNAVVKNPFQPGKKHSKGAQGPELSKLKKAVSSGGMGSKMSKVKKGSSY